MMTHLNKFHKHGFAYSTIINPSVAATGFKRFADIQLELETNYVQGDVVVFSMTSPESLCSSSFYLKEFLELISTAVPLEQV
jgi:hypothetical protein